MDKIKEDEDPRDDDSNFEEVKLIDNQEEAKEESRRPEIATKVDVIETRIKNGKADTASKVYRTQNPELKCNWTLVWYAKEVGYGSGQEFGDGVGGHV